MITVIAKLTVDPSRSEDFVLMFRRVAEDVRSSEPGTLLYKLSRPVDGAGGEYQVVEFYSDMAAFQVHMRNSRSNPLLAEMGRYLNAAPDVAAFEDIL